MAMTREQRLKRRRVAARLRRQTERLEREKKGEHRPHNHTPSPVAATTYKWLPYKPASLLSEEERARGHREGRFTAYGDLWLGPMPVPVPAG